MGTIKGSEIFNYSIEDTFDGFMKVTKREFRKFNDKNPVGSKFDKVVKQNSKMTLKMVTEVTAFEVNKLYEVKSTLGEDIYISRFTFKDAGDNMTKVTLEEIQNPKNIMSKIGVVISGFSGGSKVKNKLNNMSSLVEEEVQRKLNNLSKNKKS